MTGGSPADRRNRMVERLAESGRITDEATLDALRAVPRHEFVPEARRDAAYEDRPLPIDDGQTISAPHMVGIMVELLDAAPGDTVLEIGTGCGYHAAVTAEVVGAENVYSVEYSDRLAEQARSTLDDIGYGDISIRVGDGRDGWPEHAPYDRAYLTCAARELPEPVAEQVCPGGRILAPIGRRRQTLERFDKRTDGTLERSAHGGVRFVRMRR
ncbi:protein-L-isoaspartate(D-aspartate) O-methyltransferase [Natronoarchaeum sp. GCM10025703]|uniref:protein-L-isoaspartate(D-aspartate) O-methyltransferase n=1 Tax=unclassified Natronoarchaeum TaxID=2620183 RepID=UPI0036161650